jgi:hypothetical protein
MLNMQGLAGFMAIADRMGCFSCSNPNTFVQQWTDQEEIKKKETTPKEKSPT